MGIWIAAGIVLVLLAVLFGAAGFFFRFAILRAKKERTDEEYEEPLSGTDAGSPELDSSAYGGACEHGFF